MRPRERSSGAASGSCSFTLRSGPRRRLRNSRAHEAGADDADRLQFCHQRSLRIWNALTMSVTPVIRAQMPANTSST